MVTIKVKNLKLNKYLINIDFLEQEAIGFWAQDEEIIDRFFDVIAGINKNGRSCFYKEENIYNNKDYFKTRIYLDYQKKYLSTLKINYLENLFSQRYKTTFDKNNFRSIAETLDIRGETEITNVFSYTKVGNTFVNYALTRSLNKSIIIIKNPTLNISIKSDIDYIVSGLTDKKRYTNMLIAPNNLEVFKGKLDKVIFFSKYNKSILVANDKDNLIVINAQPEEIHHYADSIITHYATSTILLNNIPKISLRNLQKAYICKMIPIYQIDKLLLGGNNEKG